jgi:hypothetical protein
LFAAASSVENAPTPKTPASLPLKLPAAIDPYSFHHAHTRKPTATLEPMKYEYGKSTANNNWYWHLKAAKDSAR